MLELAAALATFIELHGPDGQEYWLNPTWITTIREPIVSDQKHFALGARCIIVTTNGRFLAVHETCDEVRAEVAKAR